MANNDQWQSRIGFVLACIGSAVGLGNIWRFSYMTYENGGGAFLIPYFVALLTAGIPIMLLEFGVGHKFNSTSVGAFAKINKKWEALGWWPQLASFGLMSYYMVILAWALSYVGYAFTGAWGGDPNAFFFGNYLQLSSGFWDLQGFSMPVIISFVLIWIINYVITVQGVSAGIEKACKIFMPLLFALSIIIVIRGVTLPGAWEGINWYLAPNFTKIANAQVWVAAYGQIFFTLSVAFGVMIAYASYLPRKSDIVNNAFITCLANCGYSFFMGFGTFGIIGYMAKTQGVAFQDVITQSIGLAFVAYPKAIDLLPAANTLFGIMFFTALIFAGLSSSVSLIEALASGLIEKFDMPRKKAINTIAAVGFLIGLMYTTKAGLYIFDTVDQYVAKYIIIMVGLYECILIGWIYGSDKIRNYVNPLSDFAIGKWWDVCIKYITPVILGVSFVQLVYGDLVRPYGGYPWSGIIVFGWGSIAAVIIVGIVLASKPWKSDVLSRPVEEVQE